MRRVVAGGLASLVVIALLTASPPIEIRATRASAPSVDAADLAAVLAPAGNDVARLPARVVDFEAALLDEKWPVLDARGKRVGMKRWRVVLGTGNCCENYLASAPTGRLFDFGGDYLYFSDDEGRTWRQVRPSDPLPNFGEGAVAVAPGGDIVGVAWNPYHGDRVVPFKYEAEEETWYYTHTKLHQPFFDRESLAVIPGPFTFAGEKYPYVVLLKGGWPSKDPWFVSFDGLNYFVPSSKVVDQITGSATKGFLKFKGTPAHDWLQTNAQTRVTALGKATAISGLSSYVNDSFSPTFALFGGDLRWTPFEFKNDSVPGSGHMLSDSKGRLHYVFTPENKIVYMLSADGGQTWARMTIDLPEGSARFAQFDFRASGKLDVTAIAAHVRNSETNVSQDYVYKLTTKNDRIKLTRVYLVGDGDLPTGVGVASSQARFDFATITLLPDGRVAVSFLDKARGRPAMAVEI